MNKLWGPIAFTVFGVFFFFASILFIIPSAKNSSEVCTLEVSAVVLENEKYSESDSDGYKRTYYRQLVEYEVNGEIYKNIYPKHSQKPIPIGDSVTFWVDPDNPRMATSNRNWVPVIFISIGMSIGFFLIGFIPLRMNLKQKEGL